MASLTLESAEQQNAVRLTAKYTYTPIVSDGNEIRVLTIQPESPFSRSIVVCSLRPTKILGSDSECENYETISYCWGDARCRGTILLDDKLIDVPLSSENALRRVRLPDQPRVVWIDAVCIDQENLDERSQQVAIMAKIYEMSIGNLVYLGDGNEHTEAALASIDVLMKGEIGEVIKDGRLLCHTTHDDDGMERRSSDPLDMAVDQQALFAFYGNPWFSRAWVLQESALALWNTCYCGQFEFLLRDTLIVASWLLHKWNSLDFGESPSQNDLPTYIENAGKMFDHSLSPHSIHGSGKLRPGIMTTLSASQQRQCLDPRDKVFAFLGLLDLASPRGHLPRELIPSYSRSLKEVLVSAAAWVINSREEYFVHNLLSGVSHRSTEDVHVDGLPSWVPRWHRRLDTGEDVAEMGQFYELDRRSRHYDISHLYDLNIVSWPDPTCFGTWTVSGYTIDSVRDIGRACRRVDDAALLSEYLTPLHRHLESVGDHSLDTMSEIITAGRWSDGLRMTRESIDICNAIVQELLLTQADPSTLQVWRSDDFRWSRQAACKHRCIGMTQHGRTGLVPKITVQGDVVVYIVGGATPMILRPHGGNYEVIGPAYVHGIMEQEFVDGLGMGGAEKLEKFSLI